MDLWQELEDVLQQQKDLLSRLLVKTQEQTVALRASDLPALIALNKQIGELAGHLAVLDRKREDIAAALAGQLGLPVFASISDLLARVTAPATANMDGLIGELRQLVGDLVLQTRLNCYVAGQLSRVTGQLLTIYTSGSFTYDPAGQTRQIGGGIIERQV
ncbi:MAG: flagellar protein FlgN [Bacillota bacterium]|uniref:flagellar protein FlgN n=1 Tax=Desulfurispora thermophila TaxID=265470 RepID=UPI00037C16E2|nr:flagellar protein FlgN [Desulfurispora thermophila]